MIIHNPPQKTNNPLAFATLTTCLIAASGLIAELVLNKQGKSLCHTSACEIVAKYVRFGEPALLAAGACFFILLAGAIFFGRRYITNKTIANLPVLLLAGAASFDGTLIGFQFITLGQKCLICLTVAITLIFVSVLHSATLRKWSIALICITAWIAGFLASSIIIMPDVTTASSGMIFYERDATKEVTAPATATLIFSMTCPHCKDVLKYLSEKNPDNMAWRFAIVDQDKSIINKLGYFYNNAAKSNNPFELLLKSKEKDNSHLAPEILAKFPNLTRQARLFLSNNGITGIPVLIIDTNSNKRLILTGTEEIFSYLKDNINR